MDKWAYERMVGMINGTRYTLNKNANLLDDVVNHVKANKEHYIRGGVGAGAGGVLGALIAGSRKSKSTGSVIGGAIGGATLGAGAGVGGGMLYDYIKNLRDDKASRDKQYKEHVKNENKVKESIATQDEVSRMDDMGSWETGLIVEENHDKKQKLIDNINQVLASPGIHKTTHRYIGNLLNAVNNLDPADPDFDQKMLEVGKNLSESVGNLNDFRKARPFDYSHNERNYLNVGGLYESPSHVITGTM